jgi:hypothetical protein
MLDFDAAGFRVDGNFGELHAADAVLADGQLRRSHHAASATSIPREYAASSD